MSAGSLLGFSTDTDLRNTVSGWELVEDVLLVGTGAVSFDAKLLPEHVHGIHQVRQDCNATQKASLWHFSHTRVLNTVNRGGGCTKQRSMGIGSFLLNSACAFTSRAMNYAISALCQACLKPHNSPLFQTRRVPTMCKGLFSYSLSLWQEAKHEEANCSQGMSVLN